MKRNDGIVADCGKPKRPIGRPRLLQVVEKIQESPTYTILPQSEDGERFKALLDILIRAIEGEVSVSGFKEEFKALEERFFGGN